DALENAGRRPAGVYARSVLYTTLSPCAMCSGAILLYRIPRVVVGENVTFRGEEDLLRARGVGVEVLQDSRCTERMRRVIREHPTIGNEDIGVGAPRGRAAELHAAPDGVQQAQRRLRACSGPPRVSVSVGRQRSWWRHANVQGGEAYARLR